MALWQDLPLGPFDLLYMDPPWSWRTWSEKGAGRKPPYNTTPLEALKTLPIGDIAAKDSLLAMWILGSHIDQGIELARHWGFSVSSDLFIWRKLSKVQHLPHYSTGKTTRKGAETCWLFKRGKGLRYLMHSWQVWQLPIGAHSAKPQQFRDELIRMYGEVRAIELFARQRDPRFVAWGDQVRELCDHKDWLFAKDGRRCPSCGTMIVDMGD